MRSALDGVMDPEIPACSITDLGMVERIKVTSEVLEVDLLPTFVGCPATDMIRRDVEKALKAIAGDAPVIVRFVWDPPWTTDRITPEGRKAMSGFGIAPPLLQIAVPCPYCGSRETFIESEFGPTPCRTIRYCRSCSNPFEGFKRKE
ncbi:MAG: 1,2-phenylacetyl-CoA epoxidase subunit PaaD [Actinomycetota bacterium]